MCFFFQLIKRLWKGMANKKEWDLGLDFKSKCGKNKLKLTDKSVDTLDWRKFCEHKITMVSFPQLLQIFDVKLPILTKKLKTFSEKVYRWSPALTQFHYTTGFTSFPPCFRWFHLVSSRFKWFHLVSCGFASFHLVTAFSKYDVFPPSLLLCWWERKTTFDFERYFTDQVGTSFCRTFCTIWITD